LSRPVITDGTEEAAKRPVLVQNVSGLAGVVREIEQLFDERGDLAALSLRKSTSSFDGGGKNFLHQEIGAASRRGF